ncbi:MAG: hypothetical protein FWD76_00505 [Firmicutes bacterium]|nr:hypothetical protein [Bacillota bacterium]
MMPRQIPLWHNYGVHKGVTVAGSGDKVSATKKGRVVGEVTDRALG